MYSHLFGSKRTLQLRSSFGMDYATPGVLGGLGQGYVQPNLLFYGSGFPRTLGDIGSGDMNAEVAALNDFGSKKTRSKKTNRKYSRR
jgi:hypothetical protein